MIKKLLKEAGFERFTDIQKKAIPEILSKENVLLVAPTGTGKTEAAIIPVLKKLVEYDSNGIICLYITPLRSLNRDLLKRLRWWCERLNISIEIRHGDTSERERRRQSIAPPKLLITTPETLSILLSGKKLREHLKNVRHVIIDEVHELIDSKRGVQLSITLERLKEISGGFQRVMISATVGNPEEAARFFSGGENVKVICSDDRREIEIYIENPEVEKIDYTMAKKLKITPELSARLRRIVEHINNHNSTLIFTNTRESSELLASRLKTVGANIEVHHSSLSKISREESEQRFKNGELKALVCTSSMELGIDIGSVDLVIQYGSPREVTRLLQRVGRACHSIGKKIQGVIVSINDEDELESRAIVEKAIKGELEKTRVREGSLDVLAHEIVGCTLINNISIGDLYKLVKRAEPMKKIKREVFLSIIELLQDAGIVYIRDGVLTKRRKSWKYYYENISMIPDERTFILIDGSTGRKIAKLDEEFVVRNVTEDAEIIVKGECWKVYEIKEEKIVVFRVPKIGGRVPSWVGEDIPVPYEVARRVAELRSENCKDTIVVEWGRNITVIISQFGTKVNETIGRIMADLISAKYGCTISLYVDPYRIILEYPFNIEREDITEIISEINPEHIYPILEKTLERTNLFRWKFFEIGRRFGMFSKNAELRHINIKKVIEAYKHSPPYTETISTILYDKMDVERAKEVLQKIKDGEFRIKVRKGFSDISKSGIMRRTDIVIPEKVEEAIIDIFKENLEEKRVYPYCISCGASLGTFKIREVSDLRCNKCGSILISVYNKRERVPNIVKRFKEGKKLSEDDRKTFNDAKERAKLVMSYGKLAIVALSTYGVGADGAKRVLKKFFSERELYRELIRMQRNFIKTRRFWDGN